MWVLYMMFLTFDLSAPAYVEKIAVFEDRNMCTTLRNGYTLSSNPDPTGMFTGQPTYAKLFTDADGNREVVEALLPVRFACAFVHEHSKTLD